MNDMNDKTYVAVMKTSEGYFLMLNRGKDNVRSILAWKDMRSALNYFENGYNDNHRRGYEHSMSACINFITFNPRILEFNGLQDIIDKLKLVAGEKVMTLRNISGNYEVMKLDYTLTEPLYNQGVTPKLIG